MLTIGQNYEVFEPVIKGVPVNMMNMLPTSKLSSEKLLHDISMLANLDPINRYPLVLMRNPISFLEAELRKLRQVSFGKTFSRAKFSSVSFTWSNVKWLAAIRAHYRRAASFPADARGFLLYILQKCRASSAAKLGSAACRTEYFLAIQASYVWKLSFPGHCLILQQR